MPFLKVVRAGPKTVAAGTSPKLSHINDRVGLHVLLPLNVRPADLLAKLALVRPVLDTPQAVRTQRLLRFERAPANVTR